MEYKVSVVTGEMTRGGTMDNVFITLIGSEGKSERTLLNQGRDFASNQPDKEYTVKTEASLGKIVLIALEKEQFLPFFDDDWFCCKVVVKTPDSEELHFPCYSWIKERQLVCVREGTAVTILKETNSMLKKSRELELKERQATYKWRETANGLPHTLNVDEVKDLPVDLQFPFNRSLHFFFMSNMSRAELKIKFLADSKKAWESLDAIGRTFFFNKTDIYSYVQAHWEEDEFFGYQFLNGANPTVVRQCRRLPDNFPVTDGMVQASMEGSCLSAEIMKGNIFLCDYALLDGVQANTINLRKQYVGAPLCLLYKNKDDKLIPVAIQCNQQAGEQNPIFVPGDSKEDWLLAKVYVRAADFLLHQMIAHLLRTHLLAEVYTLSTLHNLPTVHPVYKLLIPHTQYTLHINTLGRERLMANKGLFNQYTAASQEGMELLLRKDLASLQYSTLCLPDDIEARGLKDIPNFYYRDDGQAVWDILTKYAGGVLKVYYSSDTEVVLDTELQKWIADIFVHGFLGNEDSNIPKSFHSVDDLVKFVTMVMFTMTAQHSAVNNGQFDFGGWLPNSPVSLQSPPPMVKGHATASTLLQTLPDVNASVRGMAATWVLTRKPEEFVSLGNHSEQYFTEPDVVALATTMKDELKQLSEKIKQRNEGKELPYCYLDPAEIENSIAI
ncbi:polyunsaturated fatty acid lipoxygenase ALOX15B-like isoform X1 [Pygocentrus nattereri]|uniref:Lipoxygenase domain-containing protein n=1 Tax=Pygocentrus nattereri TaxID=42514 RepID=A0A3B4BT62_PYGNA|nr:polyunsaturated fatty acid lipoxygenase ALOX15B-like isoform X1 [Pygocentrus nattereri]